MSNKPEKDPMMEIFLEECGDLVTQYETYLSMAADRKEYTMDIINEIFRITHTIKADATMMLFECIAVPMRSFEHILYFYRDEKSNVNFDEFTDLLTRYVVFLKEEFERIYDGVASEGDGDSFTKEFAEYRDRLAGKLKAENVENIEQTAISESYDEPMRFYIGSATDDESDDEAGKKAATERKSGTEKKMNSFHATVEAALERAIENPPGEAVETTPVSYEYDLYESMQSDKHYKWLKEKNNITTAELEKLYEMIKSLNSLEGQIMARFGQDYSNFSDLMTEFHETNIALLNWVTDAATVPIGHITPKIFKTVEEMNSRLGRKTHIVLIGEDILVDKTWIDRISGAVVHMLRNAVDHGIESKELRITKGKAPEGTIRIMYSQDSGDFVMKISDDGRGIDTEKLKNTVVERGLIFEDEVLTEEEIMRLMFLPGVTTNEKEGFYSGRGVGMDVVLHNIESMGGTIDIESKMGEGTTFTIRIPETEITSEEEEFGSDEDFDSRR